ncbi:DUF6226 family protein [Microbacterium sp. P05]|uniref:DUF6226 family protein n=1 Tax=Microbacterium sp. P05 TaxID=3366948 RepID=UPI003746A64D
MMRYRRPEIAPVSFVDRSGTEIPYGSRWSGESPPEDTYSVTSNLERFRPLQTIADALVVGLVNSYDVDVDESLSYAGDLMTQRDDVVRAVRVTPRCDEAAAITFAYTAFPSVIVHAGALHDFLFPVCGCDACDESWQSAADALEWTVATIAGGGYYERIDHRRELGVEFSLTEPGVGSRSGTSRAVDYSPDRLASLPRGPWEAWPVRVDG